MSMENLELVQIETFGWSYPKSDCWWYILNPSISKGWKNVDVKKAERSLKSNVDTCYKTLFTCELHDLDDEVNYTVFFDNRKKLYDIKLTDSTKGEVLPEQKRLLFRSDIFKRTAQHAYELVLRGKKLIEDCVDDHIEAGELLEVDETKLAAIMDMLQDQILLKNFRLRKYVK